MFLRGVAWRGVVRCGCGDVGVGVLWRFEWWSRRERGSSTPFFLRGGVFHPPKGNVLKLPKWFNSMHAAFLPSTFGLVVLLARQKETWLSDLHTGVQVNDSIQFFPSWATHTATSKEGTQHHTNEGGEQRTTTQKERGTKAPPPKR